MARSGVLLGDAVAQRLQDIGQVVRELLHRLVEVRDFLPLVRGEAGKQRQQRVVVGLHPCAQHFGAVLVQHRGDVVGEDDVVLGIALAELRGDLRRQIVVLVLRFPIAEGYAQAVQQRAVDVDARHLLRQDVVLGDELQIVGTAPAFEQILEGFAKHAFATTSRYGAQPIEFGAIFH